MTATATTAAATAAATKYPWASLGLHDSFTVPKAQVPAKGPVGLYRAGYRWASEVPSRKGINFYTTKLADGSVIVACTRRPDTAPALVGNLTAFPITRAASTDAVSK